MVEEWITSDTAKAEPSRTARQQGWDHHRCRNRVVEISVTRAIIERVGRRFGLQPRRLAGDTVYGAVTLLKWLVDRQITPHIPVWDKSARPDGTFSRADFVFDQERNIYICPGGAELTSTGNIDQGHIVYYRVNKKDCSACALPARILFDHLVCALLKK